MTASPPAPLPNVRHSLPKLELVELQRQQKVKDAAAANLSALPLDVRASVITVLDFLKKRALVVTRPGSKSPYVAAKTPTEIEMATMVKLDAPETGQQIRDALRLHPRVVSFDDPVEAYCYKPAYVVPDVDSLCAMLLRYAPRPVDVGELRDACPPHVLEALPALSQENKFYMLPHPRTGAPHLLFANKWPDAGASVGCSASPMPELFRNEFLRLQVPDDTDLARQLTLAGIAVGETAVASSNSRPLRATGRRRTAPANLQGSATTLSAAGRRYKITNLHLTGTAMDVGMYITNGSVESTGAKANLPGASRPTLHDDLSRKRSAPPVIGQQIAEIIKNNNNYNDNTNFNDSTSGQGSSKRQRFNKN